MLPLWHMKVFHSTLHTPTKTRNETMSHPACSVWPRHRSVCRLRPRRQWFVVSALQCMTTLVAEEAPLCDEEVTRTVERTHQTTRYLTTTDTRAMQVRNDGARDSPWQQWASTGVQSPVRHCLRSNSRALSGSWVRALTRDFGVLFTQ